MTGVETRFADILSRGWWRLLLRGLAAIAFGLFTLFRPGISLAALVLLFGVYVLVDGVLDVWTAVSGRQENDHWWVLLLGGLLGIVVGFITLTTPGITALVLLFYIAIWAIAHGVLEIVAAIRLRKEIEGEWLLILGGLASVVFGVLLISRPGAGALAVVWLIAGYAVAFGIITVVLAIKARSFGHRVEAAFTRKPSSSTTW
jgi:uncharacterized membrane protein HdeD (DUF308 family)